MIGVGVGVRPRVAGGFDSSAQAFFAATGITGATQQQAINDLVVGLKADGLWSKMKALYPFVTDNRNLLSYTEDFGNGYWVKTNVTVTSDTVTNPFNQNTGDTITDNTTNGQHKVQTGDITTVVGSGNTFTVSAYLKAGTATRACIYAYGTSKGVGVDLTNGTQIAVTGLTNASSGDVSIVDVGNGWYRVSMTGVVSGAFSIAIMMISGNNFLYAGTGTSLYLSSAQLEQGSTATTYQPIATTQQAYIAAQFKYNLVNPVDSDAAFRLVFNGGWTFSSNGAQGNGTNGYADTKFKNSDFTDYNSTSIFYYGNVGVNSTSWDTGNINSTPNARITVPPGDTRLYFQFNSANINTFIISSTNGFFGMNRISSTQVNTFENNTKLGTVNETIIANANTNNFVIGNQFSSGMNNASDRQFKFYTIGDGLSDTEASNFYTRVQAYQTALNRQIP